MRGEGGERNCLELENFRADSDTVRGGREKSVFMKCGAGGRERGGEAQGWGCGQTWRILLLAAE